MSDEMEVNFETEGIQKNFMFLNRKAPYGTIYALEVLEMILISAAFEQNTNVVFVDDGVYQICKGMDTKGVNMKNFSPTYRILEAEKEDADEDPDAEMSWRLIVEKESMEARGLSPDDFIIDVEVLTSAELGQVMEEMDVVLGG
jgi:tRNA 2-thiouridine synthesizing protein C